MIPQNTSNLSAKRDFIALKAEVNKLDINKSVNALTGLYNLKIKVDQLDFDKLKTVPVDFKNLGNIVIKEVVKKTVYNKVNTKVNNIENKILDATTSIHM